MPLSFNDILASDAEQIFCNANEFGTEIIHTSPDGTTETVNGVMDYDSLAAINSAPSDQHGTRIKQRAIIELPLTVSVTEERSGGQYPSTFYADGFMWLAVRIIGRDAGTQSVEVKRTDQKATKRI